MASRVAFCGISALRSSCRVPLVSSRTYAGAASSALHARKTFLSKNKNTSPVAKASTTVGSTVADEVSDQDVSPEAVSTPLESDRSSSRSQTASSSSSPLGADQSDSSDGTVDWSNGYQGLSAKPFPKETIDLLLAPVDPEDVEVKPDGMIYLPEIKYRRVLNKAFGPGGWGLAPWSKLDIGPKVVSREHALFCLGRLVAVARGEQEYFDPDGIATASEACKSNALMRCCKDLGIASELWDPRFIREFKAKYAVEVFATHAVTKKAKKLWRRKDQPKFEYPYRE
ncbi:mitochondrial genome maintenance MGM101 [Laetiporus sulphureus 93-53]|uniref:Mitochondrial genome maintenance protein MGM101 n=1 Tax=Laetiporus sulphureus 93-53 TaxID=1314785 RepID=A0A165DSS5_9APHY|nr:mitochondrial genome maintenance MGM101 [Laetiporus sulphureus 93-53]KZT05558.1 mitochondrial genome maintenance MGM101 [Laetiporus sulphureus 93-53]